MDKQGIIGQLELDINALQRQVEEFKKHPEKVTALEWELFVQRLHLMYDYSRQLQLNVQQQTPPPTEERKQPEPVTVPVPHENETPKVNVPHIVAKETVCEEMVETTVTAPRIEIKETSEAKGQQAEVIAHINTPVTETKATPVVSSQKQKKPTVSVGGLFGDTISVADKFKDEPSVGDRIAKSKSEKSVADKMQHKPVKDLKDAIGINEKFLFINELFDGNLQDYSEALNKLNASGDLNSAQQFIRAELAIRYNWIDDNQHVKNFHDLVERRFS